jgi:deoxycytidine triphosphate deaminase
MLTGIEIRDANIIVGGIPAGYRPSSYDVHVAQIITHEAKSLAMVTIPPQGIVQVVSRERIRLPPTMTGLATVKTGLCNQGILALNIGIIDPGYEGRISSFLLNFAKVPRVITRGDAFLRLQFVTLPNGTHQSSRIDDETYLSERRKGATQFGETFLNLSEEVKSEVAKGISGARAVILTGAGAAAFVLALFTFFLNYSSLYMVRGWMQPADSVRAEAFRDQLDNQVASLTRANDELIERVRALEVRLREHPSLPAPPHQ